MHAATAAILSRDRAAVAPPGRVPHAQARIELAHSDDIALGALLIRPSSREIERDGKPEVIEPRVMQVLVALVEADGAVVSRDDLVQSCWNGRAISEDAINRCIGRLRRIAEADGGQSFTIQTIARVGYRLSAGEAPVAVSQARKAVAPDAVAMPLLREAANRPALMPLLFVVLLALQLGVWLTGIAGGISGAGAISDGVLLLTGVGLALSLLERRRSAG